MPYANGPIHIGHLVEYVQTDIFARFLKLTGAKAIYCCADDTHGTPIEINAKKQGIPPEKLIEKYYKEHTRDFKDFHIHFDSYYSTNSPENKHYSELIFKRLNEGGHIYKKSIKQLYCEKCKRFLPDRFVKGKCPKCGAEDQYGDVCEVCSSAHKTTDLIDPKCSICGSTPIKKESMHYFFKLSNFSEKLKDYITTTDFQKEVKNFLFNWIDNGMEDWCISRDGPYFGFKIPGEKDKYFYVWLDAPIGYISSTANYCKSSKEKVEDYWNSPDAEIIHVIGKDIIYFHFLFWPAMLMASGFSLPKKIMVHGFLTVNKEKMSKSRGTFLTAEDFLKLTNPSYLRYYYASHLTSSMTDLDLDVNDFKEKINNELVANFANFVYRVLSFTNKNFDSEVVNFEDDKITEEIKKRYDKIKKHYSSFDFKDAVKEIMLICNIGNKYFQENEPWKLVETDREKAHHAVSLCVNIVKDLAILMKPVLPKVCEEVEKQLNAKNLQWKDLGFNFYDGKIGQAKIVMKKIENELDSLKKEDIFSELDLRVAKIVKAEDHPNADKLYVLEINLGTEKRRLVAGLKPYLKKKEIEDKNIVVLCNLKPAMIKGIESQGMLLAAEDNGNVALLLAPKSKAGDDVYIEGIEKKPKESVDFKEFSGNIVLTVKKEKASYKGMFLITKKEVVAVKGIKDGSKIS